MRAQRRCWYLCPGCSSFGEATLCTHQPRLGSGHERCVHKGAVGTCAALAPASAKRLCARSGRRWGLVVAGMCTKRLLVPVPRLAPLERGDFVHPPAAAGVWARPVRAQRGCWYPGRACSSFGEATLCTHQPPLGSGHERCVHKDAAGTCAALAPASARRVCARSGCRWGPVATGMCTKTLVTGDGGGGARWRGNVVDGGLWGWLWSHNALVVRYRVGGDGSAMRFGVRGEH
ncbi:hypothetical protein FB561_0708 [Kribbella amoyensis]|uniref:Uncharacterized protein n=1 Tax=Kribbella amoyensis TaxID=996641 RepID=A0A561BL76_9ACTN|nr:hypothetical protein FB561_0708 [Kribbella amoyensis]